MASAEQQLQDLIGGVRREADAEGYARGYASAWREILAAAKKALGPETVTAHDLFSSEIRPVQSGGSGRRPRGQNRAMVMEVNIESRRSMPCGFWPRDA